AEADVAKEIFPQDHAFKITFQKTNLHYNPPADNPSQRDRQSTLLIDQTETEAEQTEPTNPETETAEIEPETETAFWSYEEEYQGPLDDETCEAPNQ
ncbi:MAG: hypothetical protein LBH79_03160, partial [Nitrososphaerota archaeon]|nr:hypothetical protein [Nitrososphaerota archaeon]